MQFCLGNKTGLYLLLTLLLQSTGLFPSATFSALGSTDPDGVKSPLGPTEETQLSPKNHQGANDSQKESLGSPSSGLVPKDVNLQIENPQAGKDRVVSGKIGTLEDSLDLVIEDYVDNQDSDMDSVSDLGDLDNFANMQASDDSYANLSETLVGGEQGWVANGNFTTDPAPDWDWSAVSGSPTLQWNSSIEVFTIEVEAGESSTEERGDLEHAIYYAASASPVSATLMWRWRISNEAGTANASNVEDTYCDITLDAPSDFYERYDTFTGGANIDYGTWGIPEANATGWVFEQRDVTSYITQTDYTYTITFLTNLDPYLETVEGIRWDVDDVELLIDQGGSEQFHLKYPLSKPVFSFSQDIFL